MIVLFSHSLSSHVDIDVLACRIQLEYGVILVNGVTGPNHLIHAQKYLYRSF